MFCLQLLVLLRAQLVFSLASETLELLRVAGEEVEVVGAEAHADRSGAGDAKQEAVVAILHEVLVPIQRVLPPKRRKGHARHQRDACKVHRALVQVASLRQQEDLWEESERLQPDTEHPKKICKVVVVPRALRHE